MTAELLRRIFDKLVTPPDAEDVPIKLDLLQAIAGHVEPAAFGAICVAVALSAYSVLYDLRSGVALSVVALAAVIYRLSTLIRASRVVVREPQAMFGVVASGILWAAVIGAVGVACAMTNVVMLVMFASLFSTGVSFSMALLNAAVPRFAGLQVVLIEGPFIVSTLFSSTPHMRWLSFQGPVWLIGTYMIIRKTYKNTASLIHAQKHVTQLAFYDQLTGVTNRAHVMRTLGEACSHAAGEQHAYLLFLDLDGFKQVNDVFGHGAGDELLQGVACRLRGLVRAEDVVGRLGGDEFVVILKGLDFMQIQSIASRIVQSIAQPFDLKSAADVRVGVSIGGSTITTAGPGKALESADAMLYAAKNSGKGVVRFHHG